MRIVQIRSRPLVSFVNGPGEILQLDGERLTAPETSAADGGDAAVLVGIAARVVLGGV